MISRRGLMRPRISDYRFAHYSISTKRGAYWIASFTSHQECSSRLNQLQVAVCSDLALKNSARIETNDAKRFSDAGTITHQTTGRRKLAKSIDRRHFLTCCQFNKLVAPADEERFGADHERTCTLYWISSRNPANGG